MDLYDIKKEILRQCPPTDQLVRNVVISIFGVGSQKILAGLDDLEAKGKIEYQYSGTTYIDGSVLLDYIRVISSD